MDLFSNGGKVLEIRTCMKALHYKLKKQKTNSYDNEKHIHC